MKQKIKFTDIAGMLDRDQMREIIGGSGQSYSCGGYNGSGALQSIQYSGGNSLSISQASFIANTSGWSSPSTSYTPYDTSSSNTSYNSAWSATSNGLTTNDPTSIQRFLSYVNWENVILNNNPTLSQMMSFLNEDMYTNGQGTLSDGTTLANGVTMYMLGNTLQWTNNPYEQFIQPENLVNIIQNIGDSIISGGFALTATGVGAVIGGPMIEIGSAISGIGTVGELYLDLNSVEPFDYTKWIVKAGLEAVPNIYENLFEVRCGVMGFDQALVEMFAVASDHWFDFMHELHNP